MCIHNVLCFATDSGYSSHSGYHYSAPSAPESIYQSAPSGPGSEHTAGEIYQSSYGKYNFCFVFNFPEVQKTCIFAEWIVILFVPINSQGE